jgi:hypothetical protein
MHVHNLTYEYTGQLTDENIDDILVTAFEGGINYWTNTPVRVPEWPKGVDYASSVVSKNKPVLIFNEDENEWMELNLEKLLHGIKMFLSRRSLSCDYFSDGNFDAEDADVIVQYALFGEIVYG